MTPEDIKALDAGDPLGHLRSHFELPAGKIYLNGNSLGPLSTGVRQRMQATLEQEWGLDLISSWTTHDWIDLPTGVGNRIGRLIGAAPGQVLCCDSVSVNLFKVLSAALSLGGSNKVILSQEDNFPTDLYIAQGLQDLLSHYDAHIQLELVNAGQIEGALATKPAVLMLTHVDFRSGAMHDMRALTRLAHDNGVLVVWDLSHSVGVLALELDQWQVDFAVGCGYKFLNGGPGAPAFLYAAKRHHDGIEQPLQGWMGHRAPFEFDPRYQPDEGVNQFQTGTPSVLAMSALDAALDAFESVSMAQLRAKSLSLGETFLALVDQYPELQELRLLSPRSPEIRGAQLSFAHSEAFAISQALIAAGVIVDFRAPDVVRLGFSPLFLSHADIAAAAQILRRMMRDKSYDDERFKIRRKVT